MQNYKKNFEGQNFYIGIDVHKKNWQVAILNEVGPVKTMSIHASAKELFDFLKKHFPGGTYNAVYEAGYCGFAPYYALAELGINCIVINAADVPTSQYETVMKTDRIDAMKLARALKSGSLEPIYVRVKDNLDDRSVIRIRRSIQKDLSRCKSRIKHMLHCNGVEMPERFSKSSTHWSRAFIQWLKDDVVLLSPTRTSLDILISHVEVLRKTLLDATRKLRALCITEKYKKNYNLLASIPGIGCIVSMCILVEIYDFSRFRNERQFASYLGLIPTCHSSGEKISHGEKTFRGNKQIGPMLVETCWVAIYRDVGLGSAYIDYKKRMTPQEAIIRIARKLSNIIFSVIKKQTPYVPYQWEEK